MTTLKMVIAQVHTCVYNVPSSSYSNPEHTDMNIYTLLHRYEVNHVYIKVVALSI